MYKCTDCRVLYKAIIHPYSFFLVLATASVGQFICSVFICLNFSSCVTGQINHAVVFKLACLYTWYKILFTKGH